MKSKILILIGITAVATLSFTFVSVKKTEPKAEPVIETQEQHSEPIGGFASEDPIK